MVRQQLYPQEMLIESKSVKLLADSWGMRIINALSSGRLRFSALQHTLGMSSKTLSKRLKDLETEGLISRTLYAQVPLRVEYELTDKGEEFKHLFESIAKWEKKWK
jgi:DNA-binding HxlR family transcriptional regulator